MPKDLKKLMSKSIDETRGNAKSLIDDELAKAEREIRQAKIDDIAAYLESSGVVIGRAARLAIEIVNGEMPHVKLIN